MAATRHIFRVPLDGELPPLSGTARDDAVPVLEWLLEELLDAAGANGIPAPAAAPDGANIVDAFAALRAASARYEVTPGIGLADHFWTHGAAYHSGAVGSRLAETAQAGRSVQGFLALYASEVHSPLLYSPNLAPFRVRNAIGTLDGVGGPYLALIMCESAPDGSAEAVAGFALPVFTARRFVPVRAELERDVLHALEHLQVSLDAHGVECTIQRIRPRAPSLVGVLNVTLTPPAGRPRHFRLAVDPAGSMPMANGSDSSVDFTVNHRNWSDGAFVEWLEKYLTA